VAKRATPAGPKLPASLSATQMKAAVPKLERRIKELSDFDFSQIYDYSNPNVTILQNQIDATLVDIFGGESLDYQRYRVDRLRPQFIASAGRPTPLSEIRDDYRNGFRRAMAQLQSALEALKERLAG